MSNMCSRDEFFNALLETHFTDLTFSLEPLKKMILSIGGIIFGELAMIKEIREDKTILSFYDHDQPDYIISLNEIDEDLNLSSITCPLKIHLDKNSKIVMVEYGNAGLFTAANKEHVLMVSGLIGKTLII